MPSLYYLPPVLSLCNKLLRKEAQRIQLQDIGEAEDHFLDTDGFQLGEVAADGCRATNQRTSSERATSEGRGELSLRLLVGFADTAEGSYCAVDALVVAPDGFTVLFEHGELALDRLKVAEYIAGVSVLSYQFEGYLLATTAD